MIKKLEKYIGVKRGVYRYKELEKITHRTPIKFDLFIDAFFYKYVNNVDKIVDKFTTKDCPHIFWIAKINKSEHGIIFKFTNKTITVIYLHNECIIKGRFNRDKILGYYPIIL
mgnify:CR=1 FL=1